MALSSDAVTSPSSFEAASSPATDPSSGLGWGSRLRDGSIPIPEGLALLAIAVYALLAWGHMHGQVSVLDEGLYLYKGWLFATGRYAPFQDFGPLTNHMPLSFLIPGWVQLAFGPGIRTGRVMAFVLGLVLMLALWILGRRLGGRWWALLPLWFVSLNPFLAKIYSQAISQVLVAAILLWVLVLTLDSERPTWQVVAGSSLASVCALVRINMVPLPLLLVPYVYWQHGRRAGHISLLAAGSIFAVGHALFWPEILKLWSYWLPRGLTPFLDHWREPLDSLPLWDPQYGAGTRWGVFKVGIGRHMAASLGVLAGMMTWLRLGTLEKWSKKSRAGIFLIILFLVLLAEHAWAALGNNYCVFCFQTYLAFFAPIGLLAAVLVISEWIPRTQSGFRVGVAAVCLGIAVALGPSDLERFSATLFSLQLPRVSQLSLQPGTASIASMLEQKFGFELASGVETLSRSLMLWAIAVILLLVTAGYCLVSSRLGRRFPTWITPLLLLLLAIWVGLGGLAEGTTFRTYDCGGNVLAAMEEAGIHLGDSISTEATVYWQGSLSPVPLTYAPKAIVFPPQLNRIYSYRTSTQDQELLRLGLWNASLDEKWRQEADYILVSEEYYDRPIVEELMRAGFEEDQPTPPTDPCRPESAIHIYRRIQ